MTTSIAEDFVEFVQQHYRSADNFESEPQSVQTAVREAFIAGRKQQEWKQWRALAMQAMRYLTAEQIAKVTAAAGVDAIICGTQAESALEPMQVHCALCGRSIDPEAAMASDKRGTMHLACYRRWPL